MSHIEREVEAIIGPQSKVIHARVLAVDHSASDTYFRDGVHTRRMQVCLDIVTSQPIPRIKMTLGALDDVELDPITGRYPKQAWKALGNPEMYYELRKFLAIGIPT